MMLIIVARVNHFPSPKSNVCLELAAVLQTVLISGCQFLNLERKFLFNQALTEHWSDLPPARVSVVRPYDATEIRLLFLFFTLSIKDLEGFGKKLEENVSEWPLLRASLKHKGIM